MKWFVLPKILSVYKTFSTLGHVKNDEKIPKIDFFHFVNAVHLFSIYKKNKKKINKEELQFSVREYEQ